MAALRVLNIVLCCCVAHGQLTEIWSYQTGSSSTDEAWAVAVDSTTKDVYIGADAYGGINGESLVGSRDWVVIKLDTDGALQWTYQVGESGSDGRIYDFAMDSGNNLIAAGNHQGSFFGTAIGNKDIVVIQLNSAGVLQWAFQFGSTSQDQANCVTIDSSGNIIVGGFVRGTITGHTFQGGEDDAVLIKLDSGGSQVWVLSETLSTSGKEWVSGVATDSSDDIYFIGSTEGDWNGHTNAGNYDAFIGKVDSAGTSFQWTDMIGTSNTDYGTSTALNSAGDVFVTGATYGGSFPGYTNNAASTSTDIFLAKLDPSTGVQAWLIQIMTSADTWETVRQVIPHPSSGNVAICGSSTGDFAATNAGSTDFIVAEYDTTGAQSWAYQFGTSDHGVLNRGVFDADGDLVLAGTAYGSFLGNTHVGGADIAAVKFGTPSSTATTSASSSTSTTTSTSTTSSSSSTSSTSTSSTTSTSTSTSSTSTSTSTSTTATVSSTTTTSITTSTSTTTSTTVTLSSTTTTSSSTSTTSTSTTSTSSSTSTSTTTTTSSSTTSSITSSTTSTSTSTSTSTTGTTSSTSATSSSTTISSTTSTTSTSTSTSATRTSSTATSKSTTSTSSSSSSMSTTSSTVTATTTFAEISAAEARTLEAERRQEAAEAVARVRSIEESAVVDALPLLNLTSSNGTTTPQPIGPPEVTEVTVATELGPVKVALVQLRDLETRPRRILVPGGTAMAMAAEVTVAAGTVAEILAAASVDTREPLLLSAVALPSSESSSLERDAVVGNAAVLSSEAVSINFWRPDGSRVEVKDLVNPLHFTLEVSDPAARCAFWNEDTAKWSEDGTLTVSANATLECSTSHLTIFGGIKDVLLKNIVLALTCSTISTLLSGSAFAKLQDTSWLSSTPSILNMLFHACGVICVILAWLYDCKQERTVPREERELVLMQVKKIEEDETKEEAEDDDAPKPSRWTRCMGCFNQCLEYVSYASGGEATLEALKELASNADTAAVNRAIATIQSHKSGIARAQISIFNQHNAKNLVPNGIRPTITKATTVSAIAVDSEDHGQAAAEAFLQRGWLCRIATLWPASHPWIKAIHFSMLAPVRVNVALLFLKITSAGALGAVFYSSSSPSPGSDPDCFPPKGGVEKAVQSFTVGLITTMLGDFIISILFALQVKRVVFSPHKWSEVEKRRQNVRWSVWSAAFWIIFLIYGSCCELYICLFLANVMEADANSWLQSMGVSLLEGLVLKSLLTAFALATIATLVLCCRPHVIQKVSAKWIKDGDASDSDAEPQQDGEVTRAASTKSFQALEVREAGRHQVTSVKQDDPFLGVLPGAVMDSTGQDGQD